MASQIRNYVRVCSRSVTLILTASLNLGVCSALAANWSGNDPSLSTCGDHLGERATVASFRLFAAVQCPCHSFPSHLDYVRCINKAVKDALTSGVLSDDCGDTVRQAAKSSTCSQPLAVACCTVNSRGARSCSISQSSSQCRPRGAGTARISDLPSCYDACLPELQELSLSDEEINKVVGVAIQGVKDPWGRDFSLTIARSLAELGARPKTPLEFAGAAATSEQQNVNKLTRDCLHNYCRDANYCGSPSNSMTFPKGQYLPVGDCLNKACYQHDLSSFENCIYGSLSSFGDLTGNPDCYFSKQSAQVDTALFKACLECPRSDIFRSNADKLTCDIATLLTLRVKNPKCSNPPCPNGTCDKTTGQCASPELIFNNPQLVNEGRDVIRPGSIEKMPLSTRGVSTIVGFLTYPSGLTTDELGTIYFGNVTYDPIRVELLARNRDGSIRNLGNLVDTSSGYVSIGPWGFDLAAGPKRELYYTFPRVFSRAENGQEITLLSGGIGRIDLTTGERKAVVSGLNTPSGLAIDAIGNVYFGNITYEPVRVELMMWSPGGSVTSLGTVIDTSAGYISVGAWGFDLTINRNGSLFFNSQRIFAFSDTGSEITYQTGRIESIDLRSGLHSILVEGLNDPSGLFSDTLGNVFFGDVLYNPVRLELFMRTPTEEVVDFGIQVDTSGGYVGVGAWGFDVLEIPHSP